MKSFRLTRMYNLLKCETIEPNTNYYMHWASPLPSFGRNAMSIYEAWGSRTRVPGVSCDISPYGIRLLPSEDKGNLTPCRRVFLEKLTGLHYLKISPHWMEPEGHLSLSSSWPIQSTIPTNFSTTHYNIFHPSMPRSSKWPLALRFRHQTPCIYNLRKNKL